MIKTIAHLSDIHLPKSPLRHEECREVFYKLYSSLQDKKPDRIVIVGDLLHNGIKLEGEVLVLASDFLNNLAQIAPVRITRGNHDLLIHNTKRIDSIEAITKIIDNPNIIYYNSTEFYEDNNVVWSVFKHGEKNNNPWTKFKNYERIEGKTYIDLFHDPINGARSNVGFNFNSKTYRPILDFKGDFSFLGDIHLCQYLTKEKTKAYSGSLFAQNFAEGDSNFHGYLLWNIETGNVDEIPIHNDYSFKNITINRFHNFDDLDYEIEEPTPYMRVRFIWKTLPAQKTTDNERKIVKYISEKYNPILIKHLTDFIEEDKVEIENNIDILNISNKEVIHEIFQNYLQKIGEQEEIINEVIKLDDEIQSRIFSDDLNNIQWSIVKYSGKNFRSYKELEVDWQSQDGIYQIRGANTNGKTSVIMLLSYILFGQSQETDFQKKFGDSRFVNNRIDVDFCEGEIILECSGEYYGIKRRTQIKKSKDGDITGASTVVNYYRLASPDDNLNDKKITLPL